MEYEIRAVYEGVTKKVEVANTITEAKSIAKKKLLPYMRKIKETGDAFIEIREVDYHHHGGEVHEDCESLLNWYPEDIWK